MAHSAIGQERRQGPDASDGGDEAGGADVARWEAVLHDGDPMHVRTRWTWSAGFRRLLGYASAAEFPDTLQSWRRSLHPDDLAPALHALAAICATGVGFDVNYRLRTRDGALRWFRATGNAVLDGDGRTWRVHGSLMGIQDVVEAEELRRRHDAAARDGELARRGERRLSALIQNLSDVILVVGRTGRILYRSPAAQTVWFYPPGALERRRPAGLVHPDDRRAAAASWRALRDLPGGTRNLELRLRPWQGDWRHAELAMTNLLDEPAVEGIVVTVRDVEQRWAARQQLIRQAFHDPLTGLPNRTLCQERLDQALDRGREAGGWIAVLVVDLDGFKLVNDGLGHATGDQLLIAAANRLLAACEPGFTVARPGGDEFVLILGDLPDEAAASRFAGVITRLFEQPFTLDGRHLTVTASIGIAAAEAVRCSADSLLRNADIAMFRAKSTGKGRAMLFDPSLDGDGVAGLELEAELRRALDRDELCVHYQPVVDLIAGRVLEFEALVRWNHPTRGLLPPARFIPLAETTGLVIPLGQFVLEQACRQVAAWQAAHAPDPPLTLSVNLSARQFQQPSLDRVVAGALRRSGLPPTCLKLEITESAVMGDVERTIPILDRLKASGVKLAIDDFGTGYSSLAYLRRLPLDVLKIDRSFVSGLGQNADDLAIVRAIISLAKSLRLSVTAEGIETAAQAAILASMSCDRGQGYLYSPPVDAGEAGRMIGDAARPAVAEPQQQRTRSAEIA